MGPDRILCQNSKLICCCRYTKFTWATWKAMSWNQTDQHQLPQWSSKGIVFTTTTSFISTTWHMTCATRLIWLICALNITISCYWHKMGLTISFAMLMSWPFSMPTSYTQGQDQKIFCPITWNFSVYGGWNWLMPGYMGYLPVGQSEVCANELSRCVQFHWSRRYPEKLSSCVCLYGWQVTYKWGGILKNCSQLRGLETVLGQSVSTCSNIPDLECWFPLHGCGV